MYILEPQSMYHLKTAVCVREDNERARGLRYLLQLYDYDTM